MNGHRKLLDRSRCRDDRGAALVEFALVAPLLFLLIFGIMEFGWAFSQNLDVRHGAREGSRLVAVNYRPTPANSGDAQVAEIIAEVCQRIDDPAGTTVTVQVPSQAIPTGAAVGDAGQKALVSIEKPLDTLTGFLDPVLGGIELTSEVDVRLEVDSSWTSDFTAKTGTC